MGEINYNITPYLEDMLTLLLNILGFFFLFAFPNVKNIEYIILIVHMISFKHSHSKFYSIYLYWVRIK